MTKSETIGKLAEALSKAQGSMKNAKKDSANPFFKSKYADLASVSDACREGLAANGLAVTQLPTMRDGNLVLEYVLMHSSGEFISSEIEMTPVKSDPQGIGSAITYARRYTLAGLAGVATEDDDGNAASGNHGEKRKQDEPISFKKSATPDNGQGGQPQKGTNPPVVADIPVDGADCVTQGEAANFHRAFKAALPAKMQSQAEGLAHDFLRQEKILDVLGKPSALAIKKESFIDVRTKAVEFAKTFTI